STQRRTLRVFKDFREAPLAFAPTFKFFMGTNRYNYKKRAPAWTDRVLWFVHPKDEQSLDDEHQEELIAWDEHTASLGRGVLPMALAKRDIIVTSPTTTSVTTTTTIMTTKPINPTSGSIKAQHNRYRDSNFIDNNNINHDTFSLIDDKLNIKLGIAESERNL